MKFNNVYTYDKFIGQLLAKNNIPKKNIILIKKYFIGKGIDDFNVYFIISKWIEIKVPIFRIWELMKNIEMKKVVYLKNDIYNNKVFLKYNEFFLDPITNQMYLKFENQKKEENSELLLDDKILSFNKIFQRAKMNYLQNHYSKAIVYLNFLIQNSKNLTLYFSEEIIFEIYYYAGNSYMITYGEKEALKKLIRFYRITGHFLFLKFISILLFFLNHHYFSKIFILQYKSHLENLEKRNQNFKKKLKKVKIDLDLEEKKVKYIIYMIEKNKNKIN